MAVLDKEQFLARLKTLTGDDTSDEMLATIQDFTETYDQLSTGDADSYKAEAEKWESKYNENDKEWRKKYRDAFFNHPDEDDESFDSPNNDKKRKASNIHIKDLFKPKGEK